MVGRLVVARRNWTIGRRGVASVHPRGARFRLDFPAVENLANKNPPEMGEFILVRVRRLELLWVAPLEPKSSASTNFAIPAFFYINILDSFLETKGQDILNRI